MALSIPDSTANISAQASAIAAARSAMHQSTGGKLVGFRIVEIVQYPDNTPWTAAVGPDELVDGCTRELFGSGGEILQKVTIGDVPTAKLPPV